MTDYLQETLPTTLGQDGLQRRLDELMPEFGWRRGESEAQGALTVRGSNELGAAVTFWLYDDEAGRATVEISFRAASADASGSHGWKQLLVARLHDEVFPQLSLDHGVPPLEDSGDTARTEQGDSGSVGPNPRSTPRRQNRRVPSRQGTTVACGAEIVLDLMDWIPAGGEDTVTVDAEAGSVRITVGSYPDDDGDMEFFVVTFGGVVFHDRSPVPGRSPLEGRYSTEGVGIAEVADLKNSDFLRDWVADHEDHINEERGLHHYFVLFWEAGVAVNVLAESVRIVAAAP